ncbi:hypothetical protein [Spirillospora sp. CA-128828]|uniref:hypothetical protein n=1 Tax=Spirillospora sp. CA-128828 TaxID=3240033 RepID=UPI003D94032A
MAGAFALSLTGGVFTWVYLRGVRRSKSTTPKIRSAHGLLDAILVHTVHNVVAALALAISLLLGSSLLPQARRPAESFGGLPVDPPQSPSQWADVLLA